MKTRAKDIDEKITWQDITTGAEIYEPVSYTHLDVYKRQGLLLWKKICCVIIRPWVKDDAAKNSKITARSSIWSRPGRKGWKREGRRGSGKRRRLRKLPDARREEKWLSEEAATDGD